MNGCKKKVDKIYINSKIFINRHEKIPFFTLTLSFGLHFSSFVFYLFINSLMFLILAHTQTHTHTHTSTNALFKEKEPPFKMKIAFDYIKRIKCFLFVWNFMYTQYPYFICKVRKTKTHKYTTFKYLLFSSHIYTRTYVSTHVEP